VTNLKERMQ